MSISIQETYPNNYRASRLFWSMNDPRRKTTYRLHIQVEQTYHQDANQHSTIVYPMNEEDRLLQELYEKARIYLQKYQKKIDDHRNQLEEFCQRTMVHKKGKGSEHFPHASGHAGGRKRTNQSKIFLCV